jgi:hypothetical protein
VFFLTAAKSATSAQKHRGFHTTDSSYREIAISPSMSAAALIMTVVKPTLWFIMPEKQPS